ncbi:hypothetical protein F4802DRAFT_180071 [Xylaria palmicola]|nr:hypothetical protein F4802DRAFT_180071 [Xylaria palmicola]
MANRTPYFFLAPTWDIPAPPSGPIQLGNVITSLKAPERPLHRGPSPHSDVFSSSQTRVVFSAEKLRAGKFGIFTRFLNLVLGLGVDATAGWELNDTSRFTFETLDATQFQPDEDYLRACVAAEPVRRYLAKSRYRKPVYVITGLKTASGARAESRRTRAVNAGLSAEADATAWSGVPVGGGLEAAGRVRDRGTVAWEGASDFVFAFRVQKIMVAKTGGVASAEDYKKGALLDNAPEQREERGLEITRLEMDDQNEGFVREELTEGDEAVLCAIPTSEARLDGAIA